jgi:phosphoribosylformylglycinamidine synthase
MLQLLASPTVASKRWIYRQYDHMVRTNTIVLTGLGAGVVRVKGTRRALAMSVDGNGRYCLLDPRHGARLAVAEAALNVSCAGGLPIGATNCLNFGNPEKPETMWQFAEAVAGMAEACRALEIPITGGNVSLYNETDGAAIQPTPVIGVVGLIEDARQARGRVFRRAGLDIVLLGEHVGALGGSEYLKTIHGLVRGVPPPLDLRRAAALNRLLGSLVGQGLVESAHDLAEGGLAVALAECCFDSGGIGAEIAIDLVGGEPGVDRVVSTLFGESASCVLIGIEPGQLSAVQAAASAAGVPATRIGRTGGNRVRIGLAGDLAIDIAVDEAEARWATSLGAWMDGTAA